MIGAKKKPYRVAAAAGQERSRNSSERNPGADLPVARQLLRIGFSKTPIGEVGIEIRQIRAIENVEKLEP